MSQAQEFVDRAGGDPDVAIRRLLWRARNKFRRGMTSKWGSNQRKKCLQMCDEYVHLANEIAAAHGVTRARVNELVQEVGLTLDGRPQPTSSGAPPGPPAAAA